MKLEYHLKENTLVGDELRRVNDQLKRNPTFEWIPSMGSVTEDNVYYSLSFNSLVIVYNPDVPLAGVSAPINIYHTTTEGIRQTKEQLENILKGSLLEVKK